MASANFAIVAPWATRVRMLSLVGIITHGEPLSTLQSFGVLTDSWAVGPRLHFPLERTRAESIVLELASPPRKPAWTFLVRRSAMTAGVSRISASAIRAAIFWAAAWTANADIAQGLPDSGCERQWLAGVVPHRRARGFHQNSWAGSVLSGRCRRSSKSCLRPRASMLLIRFWSASNLPLAGRRSGGVMILAH